MDFITELPFSINGKDDSYNSILVIVDWLIKVGKYKPNRVIINASGLVKVIFDIVV